MNGPCQEKGYQTYNNKRAAKRAKQANRIMGMLKQKGVEDHHTVIRYHPNKKTK